MQPTDSDATVWQWIVGAATTLVGVLSGLIWRGIERRLAALELAEQNRDDHCATQRAEILEELRREICAIVKGAIKDMVIGHNKDLASLDKNLALQAQAMAAIQRDVEAIIGRLNRRTDVQDIPPLNPLRRRKDDDE